MKRVTRHLSYSNVMVTVLAFVVLGGTAWAIAKNSVGSKQLKAGAVKTADVADGAITDAKLAEGVGGGTGTVRSKTETVAMTCTESQPAPGSFFVSCTGQATVLAPCAAGEQATGGGYTTPPQTGSATSNSGVSIQDSRPDPLSGTPNGWALKVTGFGINSGSSAGVQRPPDPEVTVYAVCST
jgi:hypothetical protein